MWERRCTGHLKWRKKTRKAMAGLEASVLNFYCRVVGFMLPSPWGSKSETLKVQLWEGMQWRNHVRPAWLWCTDLSLMWGWSDPYAGGNLQPAKWKPLWNAFFSEQWLFKACLACRLAWDTCRACLMLPCGICFIMLVLKIPQALSKTLGRNS